MFRLLLVVLVVSAAVPAIGSAAGRRETCFLSGERTSGMNKICYYNCVSGVAAITIRATQLCPLRIQK